MPKHTNFQDLLGVNLAHPAATLSSSDDHGATAHHGAHHSRQLRNGDVLLDSRPEQSSVRLGRHGEVSYVTRHSARFVRIHLQGYKSEYH